MPAQTRAFLFSDLRGYSAYTERHGDRAARDLLARYRSAVREAIASFGGAEIRTEGDSFYVVFDSVSNAVEAGLTILERLRLDDASDPAHRIAAGIGIHAGEVEDTAEGIVSSAVNIAARICAAAGPGELLVSDTVRSLTRGYLGVEFVPRGRRKLKGIADPVVLYRVVTAGTATQRRRRPAVAPQPRSVLVVAAAVALIVGVVLVAVLGGTLPREGLAADPSDPGLDPTPPGSATMRPVSSHRATSQYPTPDEEHLVALVEEAYRASCDRAAPDSLPPLLSPGDSANNWAPRTVKVTPRAGIRCEPFGTEAPDELSLWLMTEGGADLVTSPGTEEWIANRAGWLEIRGGTCAEDRRALEHWQLGPISGYLLCLSTSTLGSIVYWTYDGSDVLGRATRADGDLDALLMWWRREAQLREPSQ